MLASGTFGLNVPCKRASHIYPKKVVFGGRAALRRRNMQIDLSTDVLPNLGSHFWVGRRM